MNNIYYEPSHPVSFIGKARVAQHFKNKIPTTEVTSWLESQEAYNKHKVIRKKFPRRSYNVDAMDVVWEMDLGDYRSLKDQNSGYCYLLGVIDVFSKYSWVEPLKDKSGESVVRGLKSILNRSKPRVAITCQSNLGTEFLSSKVQEFLRKQDI